MRPAFEQGFLRRWRACERDDRDEGASSRRRSSTTQSNAASPLLRTDRATRYPTPDGMLTFDKLSSVFASGNRTRDDQPTHIRVERTCAREVAEMWAWMCPAQVYEVGEADGDGTVELKVTPSNCVQCGAITRQGRPPDAARGRLGARVLGDVTSPIAPEAVRRAAASISGRLHRTPMFSSATLSRETGANVFLKAELFQRTGSFKPRGALNKLASLTPEERERGVIDGLRREPRAGASRAARRSEGVDALVVHVAGRQRAEDRRPPGLRRRRSTSRRPARPRRSSASTSSTRQTGRDVRPPVRRSRRDRRRRHRRPRDRRGRARRRHDRRRPSAAAGSCPAIAASALRPACVWSRVEPEGSRRAAPGARAPDGRCR